MSTAQIIRTALGSNASVVGSSNIDRLAAQVDADPSRTDHTVRSFASSLGYGSRAEVTNVINALRNAQPGTDTQAVPVTQATVEAAVRRALGSYASQVSATAIVEAIENRNAGVSVRDAVQAYANSRGYGSYGGTITDVAAAYEQAVEAAGGTTAVTEPVEETVPGTETSEPAEVEGFDREKACDVIRTFLQEDYAETIQQDADFSEQEVDALLILAGLMDEPVVEPEPEAEPEMVEVDGAVLARLVAFAKQHGFEG